MINENLEYGFVGDCNALHTFDLINPRMLFHGRSPFWRGWPRPCEAWDSDADVEDSFNCQLRGVQIHRLAMSSWGGEMPAIEEDIPSDAAAGERVQYPDSALLVGFDLFGHVPGSDWGEHVMAQRLFMPCLMTTGHWSPI